MIDLAKKMSRPLAATVMVQEQLGLALIELGKGNRQSKFSRTSLPNAGLAGC